MTTSILFMKKNNTVLPSTMLMLLLTNVDNVDNVDNDDNAACMNVDNDNVDINP